MMKLGIDVPDLKKIEKLYESRDKPLISHDISIIDQKLANFTISRNTYIDSIQIYII